MPLFKKKSPEIQKSFTGKQETAHLLYYKRSLPNLEMSD